MRARRRDPGARRGFSTATRGSCPAASASGSRWAAPSCATRAVFLFDEPLSNLDAKLRVQMRSEIKELHQRLGDTTIYVTHDQIEAMTLADRIVVMRDGLVEQVGTPLEVYDRPVNIFVAGFIGSPSMNFLTGTMTERGFRLVDGLLLPVDVAGADVAVWSPARAPADRPGRPSVHGHGAGADRVQTLVLGRIGEQAVTAVLRGRPDVRPGSVITVAPEDGHVHLFDAEGRRVAERVVRLEAGGARR